MVDTGSMWLWVSVSWCLVALGGVALHHRLRRSSSRYPPEVAAFVLRLENELLAAHPGVQCLGVLPDLFACLMNVDGQETPVGLYEAFRHAEAFPESFSRMVARLVDDIREVGLDRADDLEFATAAQLLMPQGRSRGGCCRGLTDHARQEESRRFTPTDHASNSRTTSPLTSVRRKSRLWKR